jgi:MerR family transcriptional regulator, light-induced transcriptional regulator
VAHEHLLSGTLRTLLGSLARLLRPPRAAGARRVVLAAPEGELHELGLCAASLLASAARLSPVYLGANVPVGDVLDAVRWTRPVAVVLAAVSQRTAPGPVKAVAAVARGVSPVVAVFVGGAKAERLKAALQAGPARWMPSHEALSAELQRIAAT